MSIERTTDPSAVDKGKDRRADVEAGSDPGRSVDVARAREQVAPLVRTDVPLG